jgi:hypothetical protein
MAAPLESNWWKFKCYKELDDEKYTKDLIEWLDMYDGGSLRLQKGKDQQIQ